MICPNCKHVQDPAEGIDCNHCGTQIQPMRYIQSVQHDTHEWRMEQFPQSTAFGQAFGTAIEVMELGELVYKAEYYDENWADEQRLKEEAGDSLIYLLGVMSLLDLDVIDCIETALEKNEMRDWDEHMEAP